MEKQEPRRRRMIPLFPLGVVLLPNMIMPLHIFEERYKLMIKECLERQIPFGIVYYDGEPLRVDVRMSLKPLTAGRLITPLYAFHILYQIHLKKSRKNCRNQDHERNGTTAFMIDVSMKTFVFLMV